MDAQHAYPRLIGGIAPQAWLVLLGGTLGVVGISSVAGYALLYFVPLAWAWSASRRGAALSMFVYYLVVNWLLVPAWYGFYDERAWQIGVGLVLWVALSALNTVPWALLWRINDRWLFARLVGVALLGLVPPWGLVHVAYPFAASAFIAPATGVLGFLGGIWLISQIVRRPLLIVLPVALFIWTTSPHPRQGPPVGWAGSDTQVKTSHPGLDLAMGYRAMVRAAYALRQDAAKVLVLPESIAGLTVGAAAPLFAEHTPDRIVIAGGLRTLPTKGYEAVLFEFSSQHPDGRELYTQRLSVPIASALWPRLDRPNIVELAQRRVGPLICFEAFVPWPVVMSLLSGADTLIVSSNFAWTRFAAPIAMVQEATVNAWARLFDVHVVFATNWRPAA